MNLEQLQPLDYILKKLRLTKTQLAEELGVCRATISSWAQTGNISEHKKFAILQLSHRYKIKLSIDEINNGGKI